MHECIGLGLGHMIASGMRTGIRNTGIRILLILLGNFGMRLGHMLLIGGLLDEFLIRTMGTYKLEILHMLGLDMIIHCILLLCNLVTILALELTGLKLGIVSIGHFVCEA